MALFPLVLEPIWNRLRGGGAAQPRFRAVPAIAAASVRRQKRMRIWLQARQQTLTRRGSNLRFPQTMPTESELQFTLPDVLKVPPISKHGNVNDIIGKFGGADQLLNALNQLQLLLYAA